MMPLPFAVFAYYQEQEPGFPHFPIYRIYGGERNGSDVSAETLRRIGISVPTTPSLEKWPEQKEIYNEIHAHCHALYCQRSEG